jgi:hypothetical protein
MPIGFTFSPLLTSRLRISLKPGLDVVHIVQTDWPLLAGRTTSSNQLNVLVPLIVALVRFRPGGILLQGHTIQEIIRNANIHPLGMESRQFRHDRRRPCYATGRPVNRSVLFVVLLVVFKMLEPRLDVERLQLFQAQVLLGRGPHHIGAQLNRLVFSDDQFGFAPGCRLVTIGDHFGGKQSLEVRFAVQHALVALICVDAA